MGLSTVERFVLEGARVVFCDLAPESDEELVRRLGAAKAAVHHRDRQKGGPHDGYAIAEWLGTSAHFVAADVSDCTQLSTVIDAAVDRFGGLDIMFNNAGISALEGSIIECPEEIFDRMIAVDLKAVWLGIKLAAPHLIARGGGSIISTASIAALGGIFGMGSYTAAKAGVVGLTRTAASELGPQNIRVNAICPGTIVTTIGKAIFGNEFDTDKMRSHLTTAPVQPIPRAGEGSDVAGAALWLASDDSTFVSGQIIAVDGGASSHSWTNHSVDIRSGPMES